MTTIPTFDRATTDRPTTELVLGSHLRCSDGAAGALRRVIVDPAFVVVTHLVVESPLRPGTGRLVPISLLDTDGGQGQLRCTVRELGQLEPAEDTSLLQTGSNGSTGARDELLGWPYYGIGGGGVGMGAGLDLQDMRVEPEQRITDQIPPGEVQVQLREQVQATDGVAGRIHGLLMATDSHLVTHLLVHVGRLWSNHDVAVPISAVLTLTEVIKIDLTVEQIRQLA